jgi:hypothetical protein
MLLIFGITLRARPMEAGKFHCPDEGGDRTYTLRETRRWFTVFFIPVLPLKFLGHIVECDACHTQFDRSTLLNPTSATMEHKIEVAARSLLGAVAVGHASIHGQAVRELEAFLGTPAYCASDLVAHARIQNEAQRAEVLAAAGGLLDPAGRESLLMAAARASVVGGCIGEAHRALLAEGGAALGMTRAHVEGVIVVAERSGV